MSKEKSNSIAFSLTLLIVYYKIIIGDDMKKGFTLAELLAVVILLGILLSLIYPRVIEIFEGKNKEIEEEKLKLIYSAAEEYIENNNKYYEIGDKDCISIETLDSENLIPIELKDETLKKGVKVVIGKTNSYTIVDNCD